MFSLNDRKIPSRCQDAITGCCSEKERAPPPGGTSNVNDGGTGGVFWEGSLRCQDDVLRAWLEILSTSKVLQEVPIFFFKKKHISCYIFFSA